MKYVEHHADYFSFHLAHTREDIRVDGIGNGKLAKSLGLQADESFLAVVDGSGDEAILPAGVVEVGQHLKFRTHSICGQALLGKGQVPGISLCNEFGRHLSNGLVDLFLDLATHARGAKEITV